MRPLFLLLVVLVAQSLVALAFWTMGDLFHKTVAGSTALQIRGDFNQLEQDGVITVNLELAAQVAGDDRIRDDYAMTTRWPIWHPRSPIAG